MQSGFDMGRLPVLECFDTRSEPAPGPSPDWQEGHAQGIASGRALAAADQTAVSADIAQTLSDMAFGYAEARAHLLSALTPLFEALIGRVLPEVAGTSHTAHLISMLIAAAEKDSAAPLELTVNPVRNAGLAALLPYAIGLPVILVADPAMGVDQAVLRGTRAETALDIGAVIAGAQAALSAIFDNEEERVSYG